MCQLTRLNDKQVPDLRLGNMGSWFSRSRLRDLLT